MISNLFLENYLIKSLLQATRFSIFSCLQTFKATTTRNIFWSSSWDHWLQINLSLNFRFQQFSFINILQFISYDFRKSNSKFLRLNWSEMTKLWRTSWLLIFLSTLRWVMKSLNNMVKLKKMNCCRFWISALSLAMCPRVSSPEDSSRWMFWTRTCPPCVDWRGLTCTGTTSGGRSVVSGPQVSERRAMMWWSPPEDSPSVPCLPMTSLSHWGSWDPRGSWSGACPRSTPSTPQSLACLSRIWPVWLKLVSNGRMSTDLQNQI